MPWYEINSRNPEPPKPVADERPFLEKHRDGLVVVIGTLVAAGCFTGIAKHFAAHAPKSGRISSPMHAATSAPAPK